MSLKIVKCSKRSQFFAPYVVLKPHVSSLTMQRAHFDIANHVRASLFLLLLVLSLPIFLPVSAAPAPTVSMTITTPVVDQGQTGSASGSASGGTGGPYTYQWQATTANGATYTAANANAICANAQSTTCSFATTLSTTIGVYGFRLTAFDGAKTGTSSTGTITVHTALATPTLSPANPTIDSGQTVTLTASSISGGTTPYSYQWYTGSGCSSIISGATSLTYAASPASTTTYSFKVTDSASVPQSICSSADIVTVNPALATPSIAPSSQTLDAGQSTSVTSSISGGTAPYSYQWYQISPGAGTFVPATICSAPTSSTCAITTTAGTTTGFYSFKLKVVDSAYSPSFANSSTSTMTLNTQLTISSPTTTKLEMFPGENATVSSTGSTTGTSPYSYRWYEQQPGGSYALVSGATGLSYDFFPSNSDPLGTYNFKIQITDSATTPFVTNSSPVSILLKAPPTTTTTTVPPTTENTTSTTVSTTTTNTTSTTVTTTTANTTSTTILSTTENTTSTTSTSSSIATTVSTCPSTSTTTIETTTSLPSSVSTIMPNTTGFTTTLPSPANTGELIGGGGTGVVRGGPEIVPKRVLISNVTNAANVTKGFSISNFTQYDFIILQINEKQFNVTENYITPDYAGVTVNSNRYDIYPNESLLLATNPIQNYYLKLNNINFIPALDTITFQIYSLPNLTENQTLAYTSNSSALNISTYKNVTSHINFVDLNAFLSVTPSSNTGLSLNVTDITNSASYPSLTSYSTWRVLDVSAKPSYNDSELNMSISSIYDCNNPSEITEPFILGNNGWTAVNNFTYNQSACVISFSLSRSATVGLFEKPLKSVQGCVTTTTNTTSVPGQHPPKIFSISETYYVLLFVIVMGGIILLYRFARNINMSK